MGPIENVVKKNCVLPIVICNIVVSYTVNVNLETIFQNKSYRINEEVQELLSEATIIFRNHSISDKLGTLLNPETENENDAKLIDNVDNATSLCEGTNKDLLMHLLKELLSCQSSLTRWNEKWRLELFTNVRIGIVYSNVNPTTKIKIFHKSCFVLGKLIYNHYGIDSLSSNLFQAILFNLKYNFEYGIGVKHNVKLCNTISKVIDQSIISKLKIY